MMSSDEDEEDCEDIVAKPKIKTVRDLDDIQSDNEFVMKRTKSKIEKPEEQKNFGLLEDDEEDEGQR